MPDYPILGLSERGDKNGYRAHTSNIAKLRNVGHRPGKKTPVAKKSVAKRVSASRKKGQITLGVGVDPTATRGKPLKSASEEI